MPLGLLKTLGLSTLLVTSLTFGSTALEGEKKTETTSQTSTPAFEHVAGPDGKVLPQGVGRARLVNKRFKGTNGFDADGHRVDNGTTFASSALGLVGEYGITKKLSLRVLVPYVYQNQVSLNYGRLTKSEAFKKRLTAAKSKLAERLAKNGELCVGYENCLAYINRGEALPKDMAAPLPSGEFLILRGGKALDREIENNLVQIASTTPNDGTIGIGDVEAGLLYNWFGNETWSLSTGLGMRAPTGKYEVPEGQRPIGGGVYDAGLQLNFDVSPLRGLWLSARGKYEYALPIKKANWHRPSEMNRTAYNEGNPNDEGGDGTHNTQILTKRSVGKDYLLKANYGLGVISASLKSIAVTAGYWDVTNRPVYHDNVEYTKASQVQYQTTGLLISGLPYRLPVELEMDYARPIGGKNASMASSSLETVAKIYARF